jgi:[ribosomal protein S5]-alanine N-acetyltransferase
MIPTERLFLVPSSPQHTDILLDMFRDPHVRRYLLDDQLVDRAWVDEEVRASARRFASGSIGLYIASLRDTGEVAGFVGFRPFYEPPVLQLLYGLLPAHLGRGLATEMASAVVTHAFEVHGFDVVLASTDEPNVASIRVLERLGMTPSGSEEGEPWRQLHFELPHASWAAARR